ncbi:MAG: hypothetical protein WCE94_03645 [Candidatus Methanoperedens sp.]
MQQKKDIWVEGIDQEIANSPYRKLLWGIVELILGIVFYFLINRPDLFGKTPEWIVLFLLLVGLFVFGKIIESPRNSDYLAYYLYKIGEGFVDFEVETNYLKKNQKYINNCSKQISSLIEGVSGEFSYNILDFFNNLEHIILRLNYIYRKENKDDALMTKLEGMSKETPLITEREFISSKLKELANLIHKENSGLTLTHVNLANGILDELKDIPEKPLKKALSEYPKEIWNKLPYGLKYGIFGLTVFGTIFLISSQGLKLLGQENPYTTAMLASAPLTAVVLTQIDRFIPRERVRMN